MLACKLGFKAALAPRLITTLLIGDRVCARVGLPIEVDPTAGRRPGVEQGCTFLYHRLDRGVFTGREGEDDLVLPSLLRVGCADH